MITDIKRNKIANTVKSKSLMRKGKRKRNKEKDRGKIEGKEMK